MIENIPGAGTRIGLAKAWKSEPDGYTLIYITLPQSILNEYMFKTDYKSKDFVPVYNFIQKSCVLIVNIQDWKNMEEFLKAAKGRVLSIGIPSLGSASRLSGLGVVKIWGITVNWVPFETGGDAVTQLAGKHLDAAIVMGPTALPLVRAGKLLPLLKFCESPIGGFENVPSPKQIGYQIPLISAITGIVAPPKTPANVIKVLEEASDKTANDQGFLDWAAKVKLDVVNLSSEDFHKIILEQYKTVEDNLELIKPEINK